jgi:1-acyl-sn-glycerol-3-phosphate acyltransferase
MTVSARVLVLATYVLVFLVALPLGLWFGGTSIDVFLGWPREPWMLGVVAVGPGLALVFWGMAELLFRGGGLPVGALPPPRFTKWGPYNWVRHPIYFGFNITIFGVGLVAGSRGLAWVIAPSFLPVWVAYALLEERGLIKRFGSEYSRYKRQVGLFPRVGLYRLSQAAQLLHVIPARVDGRKHIPRVGPVVLVFNHTSYLDPGYIGVVTHRRVHHMTTAEAYREGGMRWLVSHFPNVPVRRYRPDPTACREMLQLLAEGAVIGVAVEGERAVLGRYQGARATVASILARLGVPIVPVGISGGYESGPRWADIVRRRPVRTRAGPPVEFNGNNPKKAIDDAIRRLLDEDPQPLHFDGLPRQKLERVLWRCPACGDEDAWQAAMLSCGSCEEEYWPTPSGWLADSRGREHSLAELGDAVRSVVDEKILSAFGSVWRERSMFGPIEPLEFEGDGKVEIGPTGLRCKSVFLTTGSIHSTSIERADTLQVTTRGEMWQFRLSRGSAFRLRLAIDRWRGVAPPAKHRARQQSEDHFIHGGQRA